MDGHKQEDVVEYWQKVFLPLMTKFEECMVHYKGPNLKHVEPILKPREHKIIPNFQNESSFHANEQVRNL